MQTITSLLLLLFVNSMDTIQPTTVYILVLVPFPDDQPTLAPIYDRGHSLVPAVQLAIEHINNSSEVLPDYTLDVVVGDSGCDIESKAVISLVRNVLHSSKPIVGIVGPACSIAALSVASLNREGRLGFIQITTGSAPLLTDRTNFPITYGIVSSSTVFADAIFKLMEENQWTNVSVFYETSQQYFTSFYQSFLDGFSQRNLSQDNLITSEITEFFISLQETHQRGDRVLIVIAGGTLARGLVCFAYHNNMTFPSYQFILAEKRLSDFLQSELVTPRNEMKYTCTMDQMKMAINGSILLDYNFTATAPESITISGRTVEQVQAAYSRKVVEYGNDINTNVSEDIYAFPFYDAVWTLATGLNSSIDLLEGNLSNLPIYWSSASEIISDQVSSVRFQGTSGYISFDNETGHGVGTIIDILQVDNGSQLCLGYYNASSNRTVSFTRGTFVEDSFKVEFKTLHPALIVISALITAVTLALLIAFHVATVYYREEPAVKASAPRLSNLIFIGCYLLILGIIMHTAQGSVTDDKTTAQLCTCFIWFMNNGTTLILGTLLVKLWRLYRIFVHTFTSGEENLSDLTLFTFVMILFAADLVPCIIWAAAFPVKAVGIDISNNPPIKVIQNHCEYHWFGLFVLLHQVLMLLALLYLAIINRHIRQKEFRHSLTINILVYVLVCIASIGIPAVVIFTELNRNVNITTFFVFALSITVVLLFQFLLFLPPLLPTLRKRIG